MRAQVYGFVKQTLATKSHKRTTKQNYPHVPRTTGGHLCLYQCQMTASHTVIAQPSSHFLERNTMQALVMARKAHTFSLGLFVAGDREKSASRRHPSTTPKAINVVEKKIVYPTASKRPMPTSGRVRRQSTPYNSLLRQADSLSKDMPTCPALRKLGVPHRRVLGVARKAELLQRE